VVEFADLIADQTPKARLGVYYRVGQPFQLRLPVCFALTNLWQVVFKQPCCKIDIARQSGSGVDMAGKGEEQLLTRIC